MTYNFSFSFIISSLFFSQLHATTLKINSVNSGSCWVKQDDRGDFSFVSFQENSAFNISNNEIEDFLLRKDIVAENKYLAFFHCGPMGHHFVFNIKEDRGSKCLWAKYNKGQFKTEFAGVEVNQLKGPCYGIIPGELLIVLKQQNEYNLQGVLKLLQDFEQDIFNIDVNEGLYIKITLVKSMHGEEKRLKQEIKSALEQENIKGHVEFSHRYVPVGEFFEFKARAL